MLPLLVLVLAGLPLGTAGGDSLEAVECDGGVFIVVKKITTK
jgi:hypothetical protein